MLQLSSDQACLELYLRMNPALLEPTGIPQCLLLAFLAGGFFLPAAKICFSSINAFRGVAPAMMPDRGVADCGILCCASFNGGSREYCRSTVYPAMRA